MTRSRSAKPKRSKPIRKQADRRSLPPIRTKQPAKATASRNRPQKATSRDKSADHDKPKAIKKQICLDLLNRPKGASLDDLQQATGWQRHSVRGFLSGTVRKMPGIALNSDTSDDGPRRYRIVVQRKRARS